MNLAAYFLRTALNNLRRGGQRVIVALLCIAFGVMSVVSMALLSDAIKDMLVIPPPELIGADISMDRAAEDVIFPEHIEALNGLQREGKIDRFTTIAYLSSLAFYLPGSGEMHYPMAGMGVDPGVYPLKGAFLISNPRSAGIETLLQMPGDLLITRDIAEEQHLHPGDRIILSNLTTGRIVDGIIQGIISDTPNHQGSKIYYSYETAKVLSGSENPQNTALITSSDPSVLVPELKSLGWRPYSATQLAEVDRQVQNMFEFSLKGAGMLGMLVGGIGIANTMQVLLRRRRREIAVLKTVGYSQAQLQWMFIVEAGLMGAAGSLIGAAFGAAVSLGLVGLFSRTTTLLVHWSLRPVSLLNGVFIGLVTTVCFAMFAILLSSRVRPLALLRSEAIDAARIPWLQSLLIAILCGMPFFAVTALAMGSVLGGAGVLLAALAGLAALGSLMRALAWLTTRLLPVRRWPLAHMARNNLRRRGGNLVFAMVALFVGVVSLSLGVVVTTSAQRVVNGSQIQFPGSNITILASAVKEQSIRQEIGAQQGVKLQAVGYQTAVRSISLSKDQDQSIPPLLIARSTLEGYIVEGASWESSPEGVYVNAARGIPAGSDVTITMMDGKQVTLPVVGTYQMDDRGTLMQPFDGLLIPTELSLRLAQPGTVQFFLKTRTAQVKQASEALGRALPEALVMNLVAYAARFTQTYQNLFWFAAAMAALALLAGVLLVANSVSLAMLDRRYEIGVMRAVGYSHRQVLFTLVVEYSLVALIASGAGLLLVRALLWGVGLANQLAGSLLVLTPQAALSIGSISVGLTLLTVLGVTWRPSNVSPIVVLNDRE